MDVGQLVDNVIERAKDTTVRYCLNPRNTIANKNRALYGAASAGGAYMLPGEHPILVGLALGYAV